MQENVLPNFFSGVATESGLLGPKIALWYFSNLKILHSSSFNVKEEDFLADLSNFILLQNLRYQNFLAEVIFQWNEFKNQTLQTFIFNPLSANFTKW